MARTPADRSRVPAGLTAGGQFATCARAESDTPLRAPAATRTTAFELANAAEPGYGPVTIDVPAGVKPGLVTGEVNHAKSATGTGSWFLEPGQDQGCLGITVTAGLFDLDTPVVSLAANAESDLVVMVRHTPDGALQVGRGFGVQTDDWCDVDVDGVARALREFDEHDMSPESLADVAARAVALSAALNQEARP